VPQAGLKVPVGGWGCIPVCCCGWGCGASGASTGACGPPVASCGFCGIEAFAASLCLIGSRLLSSIAALDASMGVCSVLVLFFPRCSRRQRTTGPWRAPPILADRHGCCLSRTVQLPRVSIIDRVFETAASPRWAGARGAWRQDHDMERCCGWAALVRAARGHTGPAT
jgi:hypothetical protein